MKGSVWGNRDFRLVVAVVAAAAVVALGVTLVLVGSAPPDTPATGSEDTTLADAVGDGDLALAERILAAGASPDEPRVLGLTPLMRAASRDDVAMVDLLIGAGASLTSTDGRLAAIHVAAEADAADAVAHLLDAGADPEEMSAGGMNALQHAAVTGGVRVIDGLAARGADLDALSAVVTRGHGYPRVVGPTALGLAARADQLDAARLLLDLGAAVDRRSTSGATPLLISVFFHDDAEMVALLLDAGADPSATAGCDQGCSRNDAPEPLTALGWARLLDREAATDVLAAAG